MANPYGITLNRAWTEWAAEQGMSEAVAAALYLISMNMKTDEVVAKLKPSEVELVDTVRHWPDRFPRRAFAALNESRPATRTSSPLGAYSAAEGANDHYTTADRTTAETTKSGTPAGTTTGTRAETARRRMLVEDLRKAGLSIRTIAAGTRIPRSSVHRAMRAIAKAQAKQEIAIVRVAQELLGKKLSHRGRGRP